MALDPPPAGARAGLLGGLGAPKNAPAGAKAPLCGAAPWWLVAPLGGRWPRRAVLHSCSSLLSYAGVSISGKMRSKCSPANPPTNPPTMNSTQMILSWRSSSPNQITTSIKMLKAITTPSKNNIPHPLSFGQTSLARPPQAISPYANGVFGQWLLQGRRGIVVTASLAVSDLFSPSAS